VADTNEPNSLASAPSPLRDPSARVEHGDARSAGEPLKRKLAREIARAFALDRFWRNDRPAKTEGPLQLKHIDEHLAGKAKMGLCPIARGSDLCRVAVLDFDSHDGAVPFDEMQRVVDKVVPALREFGLEPIVFRSSGGRGLHVYLLWAQPQDAFSVREMLAEVLAKCGLKNGTGGVKASEVEIYPKQSEVPADANAWGNMVRLPFAGKSEYLGGDLPAAWPRSAPVAKRERQKVEQPLASVPGTGNLREVQRALNYAPNDGVHPDSPSYEQWWTVIAAIHHASGGSEEGRAIAHEWSSRNPKYDGEFLNSRVWDCLRSDRDKVITERSIYEAARKHGYQEDVTAEFENLDAEGAPNKPAAESAPAGEAKPGKFDFEPAHGYVQRPPPEWLIDDVIMDTDDPAFISGQWGTGKSFLAIDLAAAIARGEPWRGRRTKRGRVGYIAAEGATGFRNRVAAYAQHHEVDLEPLPLSILAGAPNILKTDDVRELIVAAQKLGKLDVLFIDTLAAVTPGMDENAAKDVGRALEHCKALRKHTGAQVILIAHVGKDQGKGIRGWSGIGGAAGSIIEVRRDQYGRKAVIDKAKDAEDGAELPFSLKVVTIGENAGKPITSCVVEHLDVERVQARREPKGPTQKSIWKALHDLAELGSPDVPLGAVFDAVVPQLAYDPAKGKAGDKRRGNVLKAIRALQDAGFLTHENGVIRICAP